MAFFDSGDAHLYYEDHGSGFPVLLIAPGGMRSAVDFWPRMPWNPITQLSPQYRVIAMDQRNAGQSTAPVRASDGWEVYTADQLALLDHLGVDRFAVAGMCIGGSYIMALIKAAPQRVAAAVVMQTIGLDGNQQEFDDMFDSWANELAPDRPETSPGDWKEFRDRMYGTDFLFTATKDDVAKMITPMLVLMGNDVYHPESSSRDLARLAPNATLIERWKEGDDQVAARAAMESFLAQHRS